MDGKEGFNEVQCSISCGGDLLLLLNPFSTGTHFYHEFWVRLDDFIDIRKGLWKSEE